MYLGNESNTIAELFDTGFACDGTLQTYVDNVLILASITLFCVFLCSFCVPENESKLPIGSAPDNLWLLDKIYLSKTTPTSGKEKLWISWLLF